VTLPRKPGSPPTFYCPRHWTLQQRLEHYTDKESATTSYGGTRCWIWTGKTDSRGMYGAYTHNGKTQGAHRWSFECFKEPLGSRLACHHCDVTLCVNPEHLFAGTHKDNAYDRDTKGRGTPSIKIGAENGAARFTHEQVVAIFLSKETQTTLARRFGVSQTAIHYIRTRKNWAHATAHLEAPRLFT